MGVIVAAWASLALSGGVPLAQDSTPRWEFEEGGTSPEIQLRAEESSGSSLEAREDRLLRHRDGRTIPLDCTDRGGPGTIRDLATDPAGLTLVAADRDLFVVSPQVDSIDPVPSVGAALGGRLTSVHVDARRRVWVAAEEGLGVFHSTFGFEAVFGATDGLPSRGPYRVGPGPEGAIAVGTSSGVFLYRPDRGPPPDLPRVSVAGKPRASGGTYGLAFGEPLRLERAAGTEHPSLFRVDGHHVWRRLGNATEVGGLSPGRHGIEVVAVDRDLRMSEPWRLSLDVAVPVRFSKRFVLAVGALVAGGVFLAFLFGARVRERAVVAWGRAAVSTALLLCVGLQVLAGLVPHAKGWPFVGFSMYTEVYRENDVVYRTGIVGLGPDGSRRAISPYALGYTFDDPWQVYRPLLVGGDEPNRAFVEAYNARYPADPIFGVHVEAERRRLTAAGPVRVAPLVLNRFLPERPDGSR